MTLSSLKKKKSESDSKCLNAKKGSVKLIKAKGKIRPMP
jgi:hypothetical protein